MSGRSGSSSSACQTAGEGALQRRLNLAVERHGEVMPRHRLAGHPFIMPVTGGIHADQLPSRQAAQQVVVFLLQPAAARQPRQMVVVILGAHRLGQIAAAGESQHVRGQPPLRIQALGLHKHVHAREGAAALNETRQRRIIQVFPRDQRQRQALPDVLLDAVAQAGARKLQGRGEAVELEFHGIDGIAPAAGAPQLLQVERQAIVGLVVGQQTAVTVQNAAARTGQQHTPHALPHLPLLEGG